MASVQPLRSELATCFVRVIPRYDYLSREMPRLMDTLYLPQLINQEFPLLDVAGAVQGQETGRERRSAFRSYQRTGQGIPPAVVAGVPEFLQGMQPVLLFDEMLEFAVDGTHCRLVIRPRDEHKLRDLEGLLTLQNILLIDAMDPSYDVFSLHFSRFLYPAGHFEETAWLKLARANTLHKGDSVQGWGYRQGGSSKCRLALNIIRGPMVASS